MNNQHGEGMSRRSFGKLSAAAGFAAITGKAFAADVNTDTLRVGLIGCGGRGTGAAENMLEGNDNVVLVAMADVLLTIQIHQKSSERRMLRDARTIRRAMEAEEG